jgi:hypothetical protein
MIFIAFPLLARVLYSLNVGQGLQGDAREYVSYARHMLDNGYYGLGSRPDSLRGPVYPVLLAVASRIFGFAPESSWGATLLNLAFDSVSMLCLVAVAKRIGGAFALLGAFFVGMSPMWFGVVNATISEPCALMMYFLFYERWTREPHQSKNDVWAGLFLAGASLTRSMYNFLPIFIVAFDRISQKKAVPSNRREWRGILVFLLAAYLPGAVWGLRNAAIASQVIHAESDQVVMVAWLGVKLPYLDYMVEEQSKAFDQLPYVHEFGSAETREQRLAVVAKMKEEFLDFLREHPAEFAKIVVIRDYLLWVGGWWNPFHSAYFPPYLGNIIISIFCLPVLVFGAGGMWWSWSQARGKKQSAGVRRALFAQLALAVYVTAVCSPFLADARYSMIPYVGFGPWAFIGLSALARRVSDARV